MKAPKTPNTPIKFELLIQTVGRDGHFITDGKRYFRINNLQIDQRLEGFSDTIVLSDYMGRKTTYKVYCVNNVLTIVKFSLIGRVELSLSIEENLVLLEVEAEYVRDILYSCLESMNAYTKKQNFVDSTYTTVEVKDTWKMIS